MAQVEPVDLQPMAPVTEVRFLGVTRSRVARKARGDDKFSARAQQFQARLIADLHATAGQQRDAAAQVHQLGALGVVERGAGWA
jgi:hypothetical protein